MIMDFIFFLDSANVLLKSLLVCQHHEYKYMINVDLFKSFASVSSRVHLVCRVFQGNLALRAWACLGQRWAVHAVHTVDGFCLCSPLSTACST